MNRRIKIKLIKFLENIPVIGIWALFLIRKCKLFFFYKPRFFLNRVIYNKNDDVFALHWVQTNTIKYLSSGHAYKKNDIGGIRGGDWDIESKQLVSDKEEYKGIYERFVDKKVWNETKYYKLGMDRIRSGDLAWMCKDKGEFQKRMKNLDGLFEHIKKNGFQTDPKEMFDVYSYKSNKLNEANKAHQSFDYITIDIGRNGESLFVDGGHRLTMAKILGIEEVPVIVHIRHKAWAKFKNEMKAYAKSEPEKKLYQKAYHFDLEGIPYFYDEGRIKVIKQNISLKNGTVLDIGAFFGLNSHEMEKEGFECTAIESNLPRIYFMKKLREANQHQFHIIEKSIFEYKKGEEIQFDIILALYIFHHFLKTKQDYEKLIDFLGRLECKEMYFGVHNPEEFKDMNPYINYDPDEFSDFVLENSCLKKKEVIEKYNNGRVLYKLSV